MNYDRDSVFCAEDRDAKSLHTSTLTDRYRLPICRYFRTIPTQERHRQDRSTVFYIIDPSPPIAIYHQDSCMVCHPDCTHRFPGLHPNLSQNPTSAQIRKYTCLFSFRTQIRISPAKPRCHYDHDCFVPGISRYHQCDIYYFCSHSSHTETYLIIVQQSIMQKIGYIT